MSVHLIEEMPDEASIPEKKRSGLKKTLSTLAKVGISVGALVIVFQKIDSAQLMHT